MSPSLLLLIGLLLGAGPAGVYGYVLVARVKRRLQATQQQLRAADDIEEELRLLRESVLAVGEHHIPAERRAETPMDALHIMDELCATWNQELKHLHKRLITSLHGLNRAKEQQKELQNRVVQLDQMLVRTPDYDLRAQFAVVTKERDLLRQRLLQVNHLLTQGEDGGDGSRLVALARQNESLRGELRSARKLIKSLERHVQILEREESEKKGVAVANLLKSDVPAGAFESIDTSQDEPGDSAIRSIPPDLVARSIPPE